MDGARYKIATKDGARSLIKAISVGLSHNEARELRELEANLFQSSAKSREDESEVTLPHF